MKAFVIGALALSLSACAGPQSSVDEAAVEAEIRRVMSVQDTAWNDGDIEGFMAYYLKTDQLRFASGGDIARGWEPTLARYLSRYPDRATMGKLAFTNLEIEILDADDALVFGHWELTREKDAPSGLFTLHFKEVDGDWLIVSDHTSSAN